MWKTLQYLYLLESICRACYIEHGISILRNILMFHGECRYPMMMHLLHLNSIILFKWHLLPLMWNFLQYLHLLESICRACYIEHGINIFKNIHMFHGECKYPMMMHLLHLNSIILLKWNLPSMWKTLQYFHLLESICKACYIEHGIIFFKNILLFHGLRYYHNMM